MLESWYNGFQGFRNLGISEKEISEMIFVLFHDTSVCVQLPIQKSDEMNREFLVVVCTRLFFFVVSTHFFYTDQANYRMRS